MIIVQGKLGRIKAMIHGKRMSFYIKNENLTEDEYLRILQAENMEGWVTFSEDKLKHDVEAAMKNRKIGANPEGRSKSEILRGELFNYWTEGYRGNKSFDEFYNEKMEGFITRIRQITEQLSIDKIDEFYNEAKRKFDNTLRNIDEPQKTENND